MWKHHGKSIYLHYVSSNIMTISQTLEKKISAFKVKCYRLLKMTLIRKWENTDIQQDQTPKKTGSINIDHHSVSTREVPSNGSCNAQRWVNHNYHLIPCFLLLHESILNHLPTLVASSVCIVYKVYTCSVYFHWSQM